jgi:hypothetical protein
MTPARAVTEGGGFMWIEVNSPHTGRPVRIRDKDVGRTVRDEGGNIFYALPRADGEGHYGSLTRAGGPDQERRYDEMLAKESQVRTAGQEASVHQVHDARGKPRSNVRGKLVILFLALIVAALVYLFTIGPLGSRSWPWQKPPTTPPTPTPPPPTTPTTPKAPSPSPAPSTQGNANP